MKKEKESGFLALLLIIVLLSLTFASAFSLPVFFKNLKSKITGKVAFLGAGACSCSNCTDCTSAINNLSCSEVRLANSIESSSNCLAPITKNNTILDCNGYEINGPGHNISSYTGVYFTNSINNTIRNCNIKNFNAGVLSRNSLTLIYNNSFSNNKNSVNCDSKCDISENKFSSGAVIPNIMHVYSDSSSLIFSNNFNDDHSNNDDIGIFIDGPYNDLKLNVLNNLGFSIRIASSGNNITDNIISSANYGVYYDADSIHEMDRVRYRTNKSNYIINNIISGLGKYEGVLTFSLRDDIFGENLFYITNNTITGFGAGIRLGFSQGFISKNKISNNSYVGIDSISSNRQVSNIFITDNVVSGNKFGIRIGHDRGININISANDVFSNKGGISFKPMAGLTLSFNKVCFNPSGDLGVGGGDDSSLYYGNACDKVVSDFALTAKERCSYDCSSFVIPGVSENQNQSSQNFSNQSTPYTLEIISPTNTTYNNKEIKIEVTSTNLTSVSISDSIDSWNCTDNCSFYKNYTEGNFHVSATGNYSNAIVTRDVWFSVNYSSANMSFSSQQSIQQNLGSDAGEAGGGESSGGVAESLPTTDSETSPEDNNRLFKIILVVVVVFVLAIGIVLFFLLRKRLAESETPPVPIKTPVSQ